MSRLIEIPLWALVLLCAFAAVTFASHFLFPSVRWFFRRRAERLVARLNERLRDPIKPFKLARRADTVMRLVHDPEVARAIVEHAHARRVPEAVAFEDARRYASEIVPGFSAILYFSVAMRMARWLTRWLYRVRVSGEDRVAEAVGPDVTTIFVMNHRSNMDYVLVTWLMSQQTSLAYAVGEWARRWPLRPLIRALGGYFVRRKDLNPLYRKVLARYVQIATQQGVTQAVFPEGRLSRDGALQRPKLGILSYIVAEHSLEDPRDVVFVPVALSYERVIEDSTLIAAREGRPGQFRMRWWQVALYVFRHLQLRLTGRFSRFGYAAVSYGTPLSLRAFLAEGHPDPTQALGAALMARIARVMPVLPLPLVAEALLEGARDMPAIAAHLDRRLTALEGSGHPWSGDRDDLVQVSETALQMLEVRGLLDRDGGRITPDETRLDLLAYYARSVPAEKSTET